MSYSGEEKQTRRNGEGDTLNITILKQDSIVQNSSTLMDRGKGNYSALQKWTRRERPDIAECQVCRPTCHIFMCAYVQSEPHRQARGELISILDSRLAAGPKRHVGCRSDGQYSPSFRGIFAHFHRASHGAALEGRGKRGRDEDDALPSSRFSAPENSRHRDRPHKFAIVTMKVEEGGTKGRERNGGRKDF